MRSGYLYTDIHACFLLHFLQPGESDRTHAFEGSGTGTWLPDACTEDFYADGRKQTGRSQGLLFGFRTTGTRNNQGSFKIGRASCRERVERWVVGGRCKRECGEE